MAKRIRGFFNEHQKVIANLMDANARRYHRWEVFRDFCELSAISLSNMVDAVHREDREARYLKIVGRYAGAELERFAEMLGHLHESLHEAFHDALGSLFMAMELGDAWKGQFFTPYPVSRMMAEMSLADVGPLIERQGFITVSDPAVGGGAMMIAAAHTLHDAGFAYQDVLHVTAQDIDITACHMAYVQLALLDVPALVIHGNSLDPSDIRDWWVTPSHVTGAWDRKLAESRAVGVDPQPATELVGRVEQLTFI